MSHEASTLSTEEQVEDVAQDALALLVTSVPVAIFAVLPVLTIYASNRTFLEAHGALEAGLLSVAVAYVFWMMVVLIVQDMRRATLYSVLLIVWLSCYGYLAELVGLHDETVTVSLLMLGAWTVLAILLTWQVRTRGEALIDQSLRVVHGAGAGALLVASLPLLNGTDSETSVNWENDVEVSEFITGDRTRIHQSPDVYVIIPDRYASNRVLESYFDYDNTGFTSALEKRGFYVAAASKANYLRTAHSLAAMLNLSYLGASSDSGSGSHSYKPIYRSIGQSRVGAIFRQAGYKYYHLGSWWQGSSRSSIADYDYMGSEEPLCAGMWRIIYQQSVVSRVLSAFGFSACGTRRRQRSRVERKLDLLGEIARDSSATFTLAHLLVPHEPFVFGPSGEYRSPADVEELGWRRAYVDQIVYLNVRLIETVDEILRVSEEDPVILIQADEGPFSYDGELAVAYRDWCSAAPDTAFQKFGILSAMRLPEAGQRVLWPELSPVNSLRIVVSDYLGYDLSRLPDRSYIFPMNGDAYQFRDVTGVLRKVYRAPGSEDLPDRLCPDIPVVELDEGRRGVAAPF